MMGHGAFRMLRPRDDLKDYKPPKGLLKRVIGFAKPYRPQLVVLLVIIAISSFLEVFLPPQIVLRLINDGILGNDVGLLTALALLLLGISFAGAIIQVFSRWIASRFGEGLIYDLRVQVFDHIQRMPIAFFTRAQTGALISRMTSDVVSAQRAITETAAGVVGIVLNIAFALVGMFGIDWRLTLIAMALVPVFLAPTRKMGKTLQRLIKQQMEENAGMSSQMAERFQVGGALLVKLFGSHPKELGEFSEKAGNVRDLGVKSAVYGRLFFVLFGLVAATGSALAYLIGGRFVISGAIKIGTLIAFTQYLMRLYMPVTMLSNVRVEIMSAMVAFERVFEVLDFRHPIEDKPSAVDLLKPKGRVEFDHVTFTHPKAEDVSIESLELEGVERRDRGGSFSLKDVSFAIEPGQMVALVGPSGAGKTTITSLIPRLYDVTGGAVKVDGRDVRDFTQDSLREAIGVVPQDPHMFHDTIRANLAYAKPDATDDELNKVIAAAHVDELVSSLPDGLDTTVGEKGYRVSGGEKQRFAIARLLLKNPAIMILDEATSHLDSESERLIKDAFEKAFAGRSSLVIAHRLSTVHRADQILVVDEGRIVERGTHSELLNAGGLYSELYHTQFEKAPELTPAAIDGDGDGAVESGRVAHRVEKRLGL